MTATTGHPRRADIDGTSISITPAVILIASSGATGSTVEFGILRLVLTLIGAAVAAVLAIALLPGRLRDTEHSGRPVDHAR